MKGICPVSLSPILKANKHCLSLVFVHVIISYYFRLRQEDESYCTLGTVQGET